MKLITSYLIVRADGTMRIVSGKRGVQLSVDEIAVPIKVTIPDGWGRVDNEQAISVEMPEPPLIEQDQQP